MSRIGGRRAVVAVCAWRDYPSERSGGQPWSLSTEDADEDEVECLDGYDSEEDAWIAACAYADENGVPATLIRSETGEVVETYEPETNKEIEASS